MITNHGKLDVSLKNKEYHNSLSVRVKTTDGLMHVFFVEDDNGRCVRVFIESGKNGSQLKAWAESLMVTVNLALENRVHLTEISNALSNINTDRINWMNDDKINIKSGPAGFVYAITRYLRTKKTGITPPFNMPWV